MFQFTDIARPGVLLHQSQHFLFDALCIAAVFTIELLNKKITEVGNVIETVTEGRDSQFNGINTIIKIGTETSVLNQLRQILVRAADEADIHFDGGDTADAFDFLFLKHSSNLPILPPFLAPVKAPPS